MASECQCLCVPAGHHYSDCQVNADPRLTAPLAHRADEHRVPVCRTCHEARRAGRPRLFAERTRVSRAVVASERASS